MSTLLTAVGIVFIAPTAPSGQKAAPGDHAGIVGSWRLVTLRAYAGKYRVQGDKWGAKVDGAWNIEWIGTDQERSFSLNGNRPQVISQWNALYGGKVTRGHLIFERER